jgi:hypothetical protein
MPQQVREASLGVRPIREEIELLSSEQRGILTNGPSCRDVNIHRHGRPCQLDLIFKSRCQQKSRRRWRPRRDGYTTAMAGAQARARGRAAGQHQKPDDAECRLVRGTHRINK